MIFVTRINVTTLPTLIKNLNMKSFIAKCFFLIPVIIWSQTAPEEQIDASNPLSKGLNFYQIFRVKPDVLDMQNIVNYTTDKWFIRGAIDYNKVSSEDINYGSSSFLVSRLFKFSPDNELWKVQVGVGAIISDSKANGFSAGISFVGVQSYKKWKFVELFTYQVNNTIEAQYGIYYKISEDGLWEVRSHPRMLFNMDTGVNEIPAGVGVGKTILGKSFTTYVFCEPEYDFVAKDYLIYTGVKFIF